MRISTILIGLAFSTAVVASDLGKQLCQSLTDKQKPQIENFVKKWYKLPYGQTFTLVADSTTDLGCYRKLVFRASIPAPLLVLYLSPDGQHLAAGVMDLTVDPSVARHKIQEELQSLLISGAMLTSGASDAPVKMVVFSDFQCPYCRRFAGFVNELTPEERSKLQIIFRQLPLNIHPWAQEAAALAVCVSLQDKSAFWKLHDFLFAQQMELSKETVVSKSLGFLLQEKTVDATKVAACLKNNLFEGLLRQDQNLAIDLGITATPTVFLNGQRVGIRTTEDLRAAIRVALQDDRSGADQDHDQPARDYR